MRHACKSMVVGESLFENKRTQMQKDHEEIHAYRHAAVSRLGHVCHSHANCQFQLLLFGMLIGDDMYCEWRQFRNWERGLVEYNMWYVRFEDQTMICHRIKQKRRYYPYSLRVCFSQPTLRVLSLWCGPHNTVWSEVLFTVLYFATVQHQKQTSKDKRRRDIVTMRSIARFLSVSKWTHDFKQTSASPRFSRRVWCMRTVV